ncbi:MAG: glycogen synthase [Bacilli bacterium]|nr:glycogen synthase [Bacilli bacterium]
MKIAMIASEANPLAKSGGLADVVTALSVAYTKKEHEVVIIMPYYKSIDAKLKEPLEHLGELTVQFGWRHVPSDIHRTVINGVTYYLIGNYYYFGRPSLYGYGDDGERFAFFSVAALALLEDIKFKADIVHVHDWQSAIIPTLLKNLFVGDKILGKAKTMLTIHNPAFKGYLDPYFLNDFFGLDDSLYHNGHLRFEGMVSTLKAGIVDADKITTVSPTHREELLSDALSQGLAPILRLREADFCGIVNGVDEDEFNPEKDPLIAKNFSVKTIAQGKNACRKAFFEKWGKEDKGGPIFGLVSRLTYQKGIDLILFAAHYTLDRGGYLAILGSGEPGLEQGLERLREQYPDRVYLYIGYSDPLAHEIYSVSDFFLMPSLFEPCGIGQLIAEEYASLPVARKTGGLADTVFSLDQVGEDKANGFLFEYYDGGGLAYAMYEAEKAYRKKTLFRKLQRNAMNTDNSWNKSAELYLGIYRELTGKK